MLPITKFLLFIMAYYIILFITTLLSAVSGVGEGGGEHEPFLKFHSWMN